MQNICVSGLLMICSHHLFAHPANIAIGQNWWLTWTFPPFVTSSLVLLSILYWIGSSRSRVNNKKGDLCFIVGMALLALALLSPIDAYSDHLAYIHMIQHMIIMMMAAPLFAISSPSRRWILALPAQFRRIAWRWRKRFAKHPSAVSALGHPVVIWTVFGLTLWIAHLPRFYEAALHNELLHDIQHIAFFSASYFFWLVLLNPLRLRRIPVGVGTIYLFVASLHTIILGVFMALSPEVWYPTYKVTTLPFATTATVDQQIAGYIMWMPSCMMYASIAIVLIYFRLHSSKASLPGGKVA